MCKQEIGRYVPKQVFELEQRGFLRSEINCENSVCISIIVANLTADPQDLKNQIEVKFRLYRSQRILK